MCDETVDECLAALKFISDWFVTSKVLENFHDALNANDDIFIFYKDFSKVTFFVIQMGIVGVYLHKLIFMMIIAKSITGSNIF